MEQLIELLQQIQDLAGAGIDALKGAKGGDKPPEHEAGAPAPHGAPEGEPHGAPPGGPPGGGEHEMPMHGGGGPGGGGPGRG